MLQPKRTKYRRSQKGRMRGNAQRGHELAFGSFGIKALENMWIEQRQIEAARVAVTRYMQRQGQIWIRIFPDKPITKKPAEVRMGKGKGSPEGFVAPVTPGRILFEAMEFRMQSLRRHCAWQHKSYPSLLSSWLDVITLSSRETILNFETKNCKRNENIRD